MGFNAARTCGTEPAAMAANPPNLSLNSCTQWKDAA